jgi:hypothetical protein
VGTGGQITLGNISPGSTHAIVDVVGYFVPAWDGSNAPGAPASLTTTPTRAST